MPQRQRYPERSAQASAHARQTQPQQNELLEEAQHGSTRLDTGATVKTTRSHPAVEAVATVQRAMPGQAANGTSYGKPSRNSMEPCVSRRTGWNVELQL